MLLVIDLDIWGIISSIIIIITIFSTDLPSLVPSESPTSSVDAEALLNWMALLSGDIGVSRRNFIANHFPRNCKGRNKECKIVEQSMTKN